MGLEMIGLLVHQPTLEHLLSLSWDDLKAGMESGSLRPLRPPQDSLLTTTFAIARVSSPGAAAMGTPLRNTFCTQHRTVGFPTRQMPVVRVLYGVQPSAF